MWQDAELLERIQSNYTIPSNSRILAEINLNAVSKPLEIGVYKRNTDTNPLMIYTPNNDDYVHWKEPLDDIPLTLINNDETLLSQYFSLKDCFEFRRPRAGIIYPLFFNDKSMTLLENYRSAKRPRNYITGKNMTFKYWTSAFLDDVEDTPTYEVGGISASSKNVNDTGYQIQNAAPFIVYEEPVYSNKVVIKLQTHNGEPYYTGNDPVVNTWWIPVDWHVEYLNDNNQWIKIRTFSSDDVIPSDGNIELMYGPAAPIGYQDTFRLYGSVEFEYELYAIPIEYRHEGMSYILNDDSLAVWDGSTWTTQELKYGWVRTGEEVFQYAMNKFVDPNPNEFIKMRGLRIWVENMLQPETPFDLIELSPRLQLNITDYVSNYSLDKSLGFSDQLPLGDLSNDVGSMQITNFDMSFSKLNKYDGVNGSLIADYMTDHTKIVFFSQINSIADPIASKFIPLKTMYVDNWPINDPGSGDMTVNLTDYFLFLDTLSAPDLFFTNISLTYLLSVLFDNIGFTNYAFLGFSEFNDVIIPHFFCNKNQKITQVLSALVGVTRSAMYFDEYNNLIVASKEYLSGVNRDTNLSLYGDDIDEYLSNIESITIDKIPTFNDGEIRYSPKAISKTPVNLGNNTAPGENFKYLYQPTLLWKLDTDKSTNKYSSNSLNSDQFILSSVILNTNLSTQIPTYDAGNKTINNNIIDVGTSAWYLSRFSGFLYSNAEIIKYDAIEYRIAGFGDVWITTQDEYDNYINNVLFNGWINVTGRVRIWAQVEDGILKNHGRGYFNTPIVEHTTGGSDYWLSPGNYETMEMEYKALFTSCSTVSFTDWDIWPVAGERWGGVGPAGTKAPVPSFQLSTTLNSTRQKTTVKASALNWKGPTQSEEKNNRTINYFRRPFEPGTKYRRFGTRLRIIGEQVTSDNSVQQRPDGRVKLYGSDAGSGGLALFTNDNREGYFLEVVGLRDDFTIQDTPCDENDLAGRYDNFIFYKVMSVKQKDGSVLAMPFKLWGGNIPIALDPGQFASEDVANNDALSTNDIEVECYNDQFDIYLNGKKLASVTDNIDATINYNAKYFNESANDQYNGDDNKNIIRSVPNYNKNANYWGVFIRGDSRVLFENVWAAELKTPTNLQDTHTPDVFGEVELENNFGTKQIDNVYRRHSLSGFVQNGVLSNFVNHGNSYNMFYEEFGTILRECYIVDSRYTEAFPTFYARIMPTIDLGNPFAISHEQIGPYGTEFIIFNVADKSISLQENSAVTINGIVLTSDTDAQITVDEFLQKYSTEDEIKTLNGLVKESRRKYGVKKFDPIGDSVYLQTTTMAEQIMEWALKYFTQEKLKCNANIFSNPMIQLGDIIELQGLAGKTIKDGTTMIVESISHSHDDSGPSMSVGLREVL